MPERLDRAVMKALAKNPDDRFGSVHELAEELRDVMAGLQTRTSSRRGDTAVLAVRGELARLESQGERALTEATEIAERPLERVAASVEPTRALMPPRRRVLLAGAAVAVVAALILAGWLLVARGRGRGAPVVAAPRSRQGRSPGSPERLLPRLRLPLPVSSAATPTRPPAPSETVRVEVFAYPLSDVAVDGRSLGRKLRTSVELAPGRHEFSQSIPGYREQRVAVDVDARTGRVDLKLPAYGLLTVTNAMDVPLRAPGCSSTALSSAACRSAPARWKRGVTSSRCVGRRPLLLRADRGGSGEQRDEDGRPAEVGASAC